MPVEQKKGEYNPSTNTTVCLRTKVENSLECNYFNISQYFSQNQIFSLSTCSIVSTEAFIRNL